MELPPTDRDILESLLDTFAEHPLGDARRAVISLFDATVSDARAAVRMHSEPVGIVCGAPEGPYGQLNSPHGRSLPIGTTLYVRS